jgi:cation:H+ antiporter
VIGSAIWLVVGVVGLMLSSGMAVRGARSLARRAGVSDLTIGLTLGAVGTSLPEIATNIAAALQSQSGAHDASGVALGNVVGSCLSQTSLLLGITGIFAAKLSIDGQTLRRDGFAMLAALAMMWAAAATGHEVTRGEGAVLALSYLGYLALVFFTTEREPVPLDQSPRPWKADAGRALAGMLLVVICADVVVRAAVGLATQMGVGELSIGLLIGVGTGLPELAVAVRGVLDDSPGLSLGNLLGSNVTDPLLTLGVGAMVHPLTVDASALWFDIPYWLFVTVMGLVFLAQEKSLRRQEATALLLCFALYVWLRATLLAG